MFWINAGIFALAFIGLPFLLVKSASSLFTTNDMADAGPEMIALTKEEKAEQKLATFWENLGVVSNLPFHDHELEAAAENEKEKLAHEIEEVLK